MTGCESSVGGGGSSLGFKGSIQISSRSGLGEGNACRQRVVTKIEVQVSVCQQSRAASPDHAQL